MSEVIITVSGQHEVRVTAERATVNLTVSAEGPDRATVVEQTWALAAPVRAGIEAQQESGAVLKWTSKQLSVRAERPWNNEGKQLAPVYRASVDFTATFTDISELSVWSTELSGQDGVSIGYTHWHLSPETATTTEREVASEAVKVAVSRATSYAEALGLTQVSPLEIADTGLLQHSEPAPRAKGRMSADAVMMSAAPTMEFQADDITVSATVEARFSAR